LLEPSCKTALLAEFQKWNDPLQAAGRFPPGCLRPAPPAAQLRQRKAEKQQRAENVLRRPASDRRRQTVFTTYASAPACTAKWRARRISASSNPKLLSICKQDYSTVHHFYDQLSAAPGEFPETHGMADLHGRVALLTAAA
jgi:hypothetical protein